MAHDTGSFGLEASIPLIRKTKPKAVRFVGLARHIGPKEKGAKPAAPKKEKLVKDLSSEERRNLLEGYSDVLEIQIKAALAARSTTMDKRALAKLVKEIATSVPPDERMEKYRRYVATNDLAVYREIQEKASREVELAVRAEEGKESSVLSPTEIARASVEEQRAFAGIALDGAGDIEERIRQLEADVEKRYDLIRNRRKSGKADSRELETAGRLHKRLEALRLSHTMVENVREAKRGLDPEQQARFVASLVGRIAHAVKPKSANTAAAFELITLQAQQARADALAADRAIPDAILNKDRKVQLVHDAYKVVLGAMSGVLDGGTVASIFMFMLQAATGNPIGMLTATHLLFLATGIAVVAPTLEKTRQALFFDDLVKDPRYLEKSRRLEAEAKGNKGALLRRVNAAAVLTCFAALQLTTIVWGAAKTVVGGRVSQELREGIRKVRADIHDIQITDPSRDFNALADLDPEELARVQEGLAENRRLTAFETSLIEIERTCEGIVSAEMLGERIEGLGEGRGVGYHLRSAAKDVLCFGTTEHLPEGTQLSASAVQGMHLGLASRSRIQREFAERLAANATAELGPDATAEEREDARQHAENLPRARELFEILNGEAPEVLADGVSLQEQIRAFHNDFSTTATAPLFQDPRHPNDPSARVSLLQLTEMLFNKTIEVGDSIDVWVDNPIVDIWAIKGATSTGYMPPGPSTLRPNFMKVEDIVPLIPVLYRELVANRSAALIELTEQQLNAINNQGADSTEGGIEVHVPEANINVKNLTGITLPDEPSFFDLDNYREAFSNPIAGTATSMATTVVFFLMFARPYFQRRKLKGEQESKIGEFNVKRTKLEGGDDMRDGAEFTLASNLSERLNGVFQSGAFGGSFKSLSITPELVLSAMREAAAKDRIALVKPSALEVRDNPFAHMLHMAEGYGELLAEVVVPDGPTPPAVIAYNDLVRSYKNSASLTWRILQELSPGIDKVFDKAIDDPKSIEPANIARVPEALQKSRAETMTAINSTLIGNLQFKIRHEQTRLDYLRYRAYPEIYREIQGQDPEKNERFLDRSIDLMHDSIEGLYAENPAGIDSMRDTGLRHHITEKLRDAYKLATAEITRADKEIQGISSSEVADLQYFTGATKAVIAAAQNQRKKRMDEDEKFAMSDDPHVNQFSSTEAVERQARQDLLRKVSRSWKQNPGNVDMHETPVRFQLRAIQEAVRGTSFFGTQYLPPGEWSLSARVEPRKRPKKGEKRQSEQGAEGDAETQFTDYHVVEFTFSDPDRNEVLKQVVQLRDILSGANDTNKVKGIVASWIQKRQTFFALKMSQHALETGIEKGKAENAAAIKAVQARLAPLGVGPDLKAHTDFKMLDPLNPKASAAATILLNELMPRTRQRTDLIVLEDGNQDTKRRIEQDIDPIFDRNLQRPAGGPERSEVAPLGKEEAQELAADRLKRTKNRVSRLVSIVDPSALEARRNAEELDTVQRIIEILARKENWTAVGGANIGFRYNPTNGQFIIGNYEGIVTRLTGLGRTPPGKEVRVSSGELLSTLVSGEASGNLRRALVSIKSAKRTAE